ncbi:HAD family hydrolase [Micromonospora sp. R77]|uniref:HAD family hydrolase n=1 Tax=Micromonospora sp. R77 TaxID=2925836 RepID=UPI001F600D6F|nr:HAD family hydrolase [Micromonospora sp. R77]MCI4066028.1 HAD family hydrolase [Micromonospora sp. R77]
MIYSTRALALTAGERPPLVGVERRHGQDVSFMTARAGHLLQTLSATATVMPATTRAAEQLHRVMLPGHPHHFMVAANGGLLFVDGHLDVPWNRRVRRRLAGVASLHEVRTHVGHVSHQPWVRKLRTVADLFLCAEIDPSRMSADWLMQAIEWAAEGGWRVSVHRRKIYWLPGSLTKGAAVREVADRIGAEMVLAAGDSALDVDLLETADQGMHPRHGDLFGSGWSAPHVNPTPDTGVLAGENIVEWFLTVARERAGAGT